MILVMVLLGCSTAPTPDTNYYSLISSNNTQTANALTVIPVIEQLPDYLKQTSLVILQGEHQVYFANYHRWAQPVLSSITYILTAELNRPGRGCNVENNRIKIRIEQFSPTDQGEVILTGVYAANKTFNAFDIRLDLAESGYNTSVKTMNKALLQLAKQIC